MKKHLIFVVLICVASVLAAPAAAKEPGFYVGAGFGLPTFDLADFNPEYANLRFEEKSFGFKVFGGYQIFKYLGVEAAYTDYSTITRRETAQTMVDQELNVGIQTWDVSAVGTLPLGRKTDAFARIGYASWNADVLLTLNDVRDPSNNVREDQGRDGTDLCYGLGLDFRFKKLGIRVEGDWQEIPDTGGAFMIGAALTYHF